MSDSQSEQLLTLFVRDLSVCSREEMESRWGGVERAALEAIGEDFQDRLRNHNPIYFLLQRIFFDNDPSLLYAPLHRDRICQSILEYILDPSQADSGLVLLVQRDSFKSTIAHRAVPLWFALREKHLFKRDATILLRHHKEEMASDNLVQLRQKCISSQFLKKFWPEFCSDEDFGTKCEFDWPCKVKGYLAEPSVLAAGIATKTTGRHFNLRLNDDLVTMEHRESNIVRDDAFNKYQGERYTAATGRTWEINTGTPYHPNDLWKKLIDSNIDGRPLYKSILIGAADEELSEKSLSFPTRHTRVALERMRGEELARSRNDDLFNLQMLCKYRLSRIVAAQWDWIGHCKQVEIPQDAWRVITLDPCWKGTINSGKGDFASIQVWALERRGALVLKYLIDGSHSNELTDAEGIEIIFRLMRRYGVTTVAPEEIGGRAFRERLKREANSRGVPIDVIDLKYTNIGKSQRITAFLGECQQGRTFICDEADGDLVESFRREFVDYPQVDHDDALDAAAQTLDPAVAERAFPAFNEQAGFSPWLKRKEEPMTYRTRYCAS